MKPAIKRVSISGRTVYRGRIDGTGAEFMVDFLITAFPGRRVSCHYGRTLAFSAIQRRTRSAS